MVQVFHFSDDVVLEVKNLEATAVAAKGIVDRLQLFLWWLQQGDVAS